MNSLVLTLGHNSSAIYIQNGRIVAGYEEERLSGIKSDSAFPYKAIAFIREKFCEKFDHVFIGHWFTNGELVESKYYDFDKILDLVPSIDCIYSLSHNFTHHDSHITSAEPFAEYYKFPLNEDTIGLVVDGFGTLGEAISVYGYDASGRRHLKMRKFGYDHSIGLMYQYATLYLGMKMNNHEYKMLGYDAHIHEVLNSTNYFKLKDMALDEVSRRLKILSSIEFKDTDPVVNTSALMHCKNAIFLTLDNVCTAFEDVIKDNDFAKKVIVSHFVQTVTEEFVTGLLEDFDFENILVAGGVFYNVKLNNILANSCDKFCVFPLSGDQGAGLGVYQHYLGNLKFEGHFLFGKRFIDVDKIDQYNLANPKSQIKIAKSNSELKQLAIKALDIFGFVNIVDKAMEYGPRALGSTSTIAIPNKDIVATINHINDRTDIMPMAPMMTEYQYHVLTSGHVSKVYGSLNFMIMAVNMSTDQDLACIDGAVHTYLNPEETVNLSTCRPQIIDDLPLFKSLCNHFETPLINTSFNYHGVPIVFDAEDVIYTHSKQTERLPNVTTIVLISE